ncbi:protein MpHIP [Marchantia polymorpha subsp. ruderalis]
MDPRVQQGGAGQKGRPEQFYGQRGKQQVEEPSDQYQQQQQRGKQADEPYGGQQQQRAAGRPEGEKRGWGNDAGVVGGPRGKQQLDPFGSSFPSRGGQESPRFQQEPPQRFTAAAKEPYAQLDFNDPISHVSSYHGEHAELHAAPGAPVNPALHTMVKMVTMLNFMKVELGETKTLRSKEQWRAAGAEFIGTLLFVFLGCGSVVATGILDSKMTAARLVAIALAHGLAITFLAGATGAISGGHLNPAVTLAFVVAGKESLLRAGLYVGSQIFGGIFGALFLKWCTPESMRGTLGSHDVNPLIYGSQAFLMELILTFVLIFVIFGVAVDRRGPGVIAPIPIGFAVVVDHLVGVPFTGASMNPARSFGPAIVSGAFGTQHLLYWAAPGFGATLASALYRYVFLEPAEAALAAASVAAPAK